MNNLLKRIAIGVPVAVIALAATWLGGWYFLGMAVILMFLLQREMKRLLDNAGFQTDIFFPYTIGLFIIMIPFLPYVLEIGIAIFLLFIALQIFKKREQHLQELISTLFCGAYIPFGLLCIILLRYTGTSETGFWLTIAFLLMIWGNDIFAYLGGKKWGRHLLAPDISPQKTWEGFYFGFLGATVGLLLALIMIPEDFSTHWLYFIPPVIIVSVFGPLGDLTESKLKRAAQINDTSTILPGHGGFFDRTDALILAAPAFYLYIRWLLIADVITF